MPERIDFWGIPQPWGPILVYAIVGLAAVLMLYRLYRQASLWWRLGKPDRRWDRPLLRLWNLVKVSILQVKLLSQRYPGLMHLAIAWAYFVFFAGTALATINGHIFKFLEGAPYLAYKLVLDLFTLVFLVGAGLAGYRRFVQKPGRLTLASRFTWSWIFVVAIVLNGLLVESLHLAIERPAWAAWAPAGWALAQIWIATGASEAGLHAWHIGLYSLHFLSVSALFVTLPASTLLHLFTGPASAFFADLERKPGRLSPPALDAQSEPVYVTSLKGLTWKQLLDSEACTECGRCQDACPAALSGAPTSPKQVLVAVRAALRREGPAILAGTPAPALSGAGLSDAEIWGCTTCGACDAECPILIDRLPLIVDLRRARVADGQVESRLQDAFANLNRYGNSFGQSERARVKWTQGLAVKIKDARREPVEVLWYTGDYAAYHPMLVESTRKTAELFQRAGVNFGILYEGERNAGNDARRAGEEGLFEYLVAKNSAVLGKSTFQQIITGDPHTYNTLKNEYPPQAGGALPVLHAAEFFDHLIQSRQLEISHKLGYRVTYHDPCYLGRYNQVYAAPRQVIAATGCSLIEMPRTREHALCCGAGGGRIWMDEGALKERPSEARVREAAQTGADTLVVACPKDLVMFRDALKTTGLEGRLQVKELADLVYEASEPHP